MITSSSTFRTAQRWLPVNTMPPSFYNTPGSTQDKPVLELVMDGVRSVLALEMQRLRDRHGNISLTAIQASAYRSLRHARRAWTLRRLMSLPHLFVAIWLLVLLWGERWVFENSVAACTWESWEKWPKDATPHHLVFVADPQLVDPHTYPDRHWPLSTFTILHTDNYLKRSYIQLQKRLQPDTLFFLGDLFDGGREWKTDRGDTTDPTWAEGQRPSIERSYLKSWRRRYGENFWLREYDRFGRIFYKFWDLGGSEARPGQRARRIISSLPGNHDLGFGAQIKLPIRDRFEAYFGEGNRVDVIGNHTIVSVDTVSLSAGVSDHKTPELTQPVEDFLAKVQSLKRKAVARELGFQAGYERTLQHAHRVEDLGEVDFKHRRTLDPGLESADFPTILLTHVPLYRGPGTPCGPKREHWPPTPPPKGQTTPVNPDDRNAISLSAGYQYQNVLGEDDSVRLVSTIGNVVSVFSGDDHDYCEIVHPSNKNNAREITVKSISWAMGVRKPGFVMVSMWNPVNPDGEPLNPVQAGPGGDESASSTMENHLCLLPDQLGIFIRYGALLAITLLALLIRAILTPILHLEPFSIPPDFDDSPLLPAFTKDIKRDFDTYKQHYPDKSSTSSTSSTNSVNLAPRTSAARTRSVSPATGYGLPASQARNATPPLINSSSSGYFGPGEGYAGKYDTGDDMGRHAASAYGSTGKQKKGTGGVLGLVWREAWMSVWRVAWMVLGVYLYLVWYG